MSRHLPGARARGFCCVGRALEGSLIPNCSALTLFDSAVSMAFYLVSSVAFAASAGRARSSCRARSLPVGSALTLSAALQGFLCFEMPTTMISQRFPLAK